MKIAIYIVVVIISGFLVHCTGIGSETFFSINNLITYLGVLIGFSLTMYTFSLPVLKDINDSIEKSEKLQFDKKVLALEKLKQVFSELKQDILLIFWSIILLVINSILSSTVNPWGWKIEYLKIPSIISLSVFLLSTIALYDIVKTLFTLSDFLFKKDSNQNFK